MQIINSLSQSLGMEWLLVMSVYIFIMQIFVINSISAISFAHRFQQSTRQKDIQNAMNKIKRYEKKNLLISPFWPAFILIFSYRLLKSLRLILKHPSKR